MSNVEIYVHDAVDKEVDLLGVLLIKEGLSVLAQPMPDRLVLSVSPHSRACMYTCTCTCVPTLLHVYGYAVYT